MSPVLLTPPERVSAAEPAEPFREELELESASSTEVRPYVAFGNVAARNDLQALFEVPLMIRALRLPRGVRVLEVGCGRGIALPVLAQRLQPASLTAIDLDPLLVAEAQRRVRDDGICASVTEADLRDLPFPDASFDLVIDFGTCYHVSGGADGSARALREVERVLCADGIFVHETPAAQHLAHPVRSFMNTLPWEATPSLVRDRTAVLWSRRRKRAA